MSIKALVSVIVTQIITVSIAIVSVAFLSQEAALYIMFFMAGLDLCAVGAIISAIYRRRELSSKLYDEEDYW